MRSYPLDSPEAAARIVALVLIADGHVSRAEVETLQRLEVERELGLAPGGFGAVVQGLCEDLLANALCSASSMSSLDEATLAALMAEVQAPQLQRRVLQLALAAAEADGHVAEAEALLTAAVRHQWRIGDAQALAFTVRERVARDLLSPA